MPTTPVFTWTPSHGTSVETEPRTLMAQFGNGYIQETADGINANLRNWGLTFNNRGMTELYNIDTFLRARAGAERFYWTQSPPFDVEGVKAWVCKQWSWTYNGGLIAGISATFMQRPNL